MKKSAFIIGLLTVDQSFGQELNLNNNETPSRTSEIRLDVVQLLMGHSAKFSYEYFPNSTLGVGASISLGMDDFDSDFSGTRDIKEDFAVTPFVVRYYFSETNEGEANGFFAEGFLNVSKRDYKEYQYLTGVANVATSEKSFTDTGIGFGLQTTQQKRNGS
ncbi:hypothetical protein AB4865_03380 [Capnocytophaga sp. ARDL2]|uniref:hypothetical protein n=1 Tax=Capnocytophaga sp. ARDL2 TaxID=3238809 RepID=UPI003558FBF9